MNATLRALFPPIDLRRLRFRGGWSGLPIFAIMTLVYPLSLQQADWVELSQHLTWVALIGLVLGTLVGNGPLRPLRAALLGSALGALIVTMFTISAVDEGPFRERAISLGIDVNTWLTQVLAGEAARGQIVFTLFLGASVWAAAFVGAFTLARSGRVWEALLINGLCLTLNVSLALTPLLLDLVVFTLCALVLMVRLHIVALQERWDRRNIQPTGEMDWRVLRGGLTWTAVLVIMALVTPRVGAAEALDTAFNVFEGPYQRVETEWQRFFAGVSGPSRLRGVTFSDAIRLGQSPNLGESVVMTVDAPQGRFWRAITYDFYTGQGWRTTEVDRVDKVTAERFQQRERLDATFEMQEPFGNMLFAANEPVKASVPVQFLTGDDRSFSSRVRALEQRNSGSYTVTSVVSTADKGSLRRSPAQYSDAIKRAYLQMPSTLPQRVRELARKVVEGRDNPYDKAEAIESFLRTNYRYAPVVRPPPPGRDPIDWFLFDLKEDFCEYFAASMVMMAREVGIPARFVEGFTSGTFDPTTGRYIVKQINAHAWVEVYFTGFGWIEFEPTPSETPFFRSEDATDPNLNPENGTPNDGDLLLDPSQRLLDKDLALDEGATGDGSAVATRPVDPTPLVAALGLALLALLAFVVRFEWRFRGQSPVEASWGKARLLASYIGHPSRPSETTYEFADALGAAVPDVRQPIRVIADARVRERYAPAGASDEAREQAEDAWWSVARELIALVPQRVLDTITRLIPKL
ncbi:MAG TPA: transglutaminaseTgpA domain-containing protein [Candidatus Limnocylindria bacterium]